MKKIILDAMGGDHAPGATVAGALAALEKSDAIEVVLVGQPEMIEKELGGSTHARLTIRPASEVITMEDSPTMAVRRKKDSSMVVAMNMLRDGQGDAMVSAGSTGALLTAGILIDRCLPGVHRPALTPIIPTLKGPVALIDCGANVDCKPIHLQQFAVMGTAYMKANGCKNPRVGLINIGTEEEKGNELARTVYGLLKEMPLNFIGNVEAREIPAGQADVLVCDAFVGNVTLKLIEGMASSMMTMMKEEFSKKFRFKLAAAVLKPAFRAFKGKMSYSEHGGAPLLGLNHLVIKTHGSAGADAVCSTILQAARLADADVPGIIRSGIAEGGAAFTRE